MRGSDKLPTGRAAPGAPRALQRAGALGISRLAGSCAPAQRTNTSFTISPFRVCVGAQAHAKVVG